jgi:segregation and condensation protein A
VNPVNEARDSAAGATVLDEQASRFAVDVPGFTGSLDDLVRQAQRGEVDLTKVQVSEITDAFKRRVEGPPPRPDLREIADFLTLVARLVALKASAVLPDRPVDDTMDEPDDDSEAGRRLAEYRLFKAAAEALLAEAADEGARSFLGIVAPEVIPVERMRIPPERLAAAFRAVLERLAEAEPLPVGAVTFSVEDKVRELRDRLRRGALQFEELFRGVGSRLEAVACFLALLELLRLGEATVEQAEQFGPITVTARA